MTRLEDLLSSTEKKKEATQKRKLGNQTKVWDKETMTKATIYID